MSVRIGQRRIGPGEPCYVIAEAGVNHDGDLERARELVREAARAGADAVKFQMFTAAEVASAGAPKAGYQLETTDAAESQRAMLESLELPPEAFAELRGECAAAGIEFLCTAYGECELDHLDELGVPAFKFASAQIVELPLLAHAATKGKPILLSTGMATLGEIDEALRAIAGAGGQEVVLLQCTTSYPAPIEESNLRAMRTLADAFGIPVGYSDHTLDDTATLVAVAHGAVVIEKHFTLDRAAPGPDHRASLDPAGLAEMIRRVRDAERALGSPLKRPAPSERENAATMRRSLHAATTIPAGTRITADHLALRRPAAGLPPRMLTVIVGATARVDIPEDAPVSLDVLSWAPPGP